MYAKWVDATIVVAELVELVVVEPAGAELVAVVEGTMKGSGDINVVSS